ncbi:helicase-related protein [Amnibacterium kyonggiense]
MTITMSLARNEPAPLAVAPGSIVVVRDAEWLVTAVEAGPTSTLITVQGLSELVRDTSATFYSDIDHIDVLDPENAKVEADGSSGYRRAKLWLEATARKAPVPLGEQTLTVSTRMLADPLAYQRTAVRRALDPANLRPRILLADAVGLGKTLEIGMILSELVRRGRGDRILIVTPRHVLEQMQQELWTRFALPFVRLDSLGIQRVRQKLPATRNPFSLYKRAIISVDTLKQDRYRSHLARQRWDAVVIDESHNVMNSSTLNGRLATLLAPNTDALILASATPHNGRKESFAKLVRLLEPTAVSADGELDEGEVGRLVLRRHRNSDEVAREVGADWAERLPPLHRLVPASAAENAIADELSSVWLHPESGRSPNAGDSASLFQWTLAKAFLSSPAALRESVLERLQKVRRQGAGERQAAEAQALERLLALADDALETPSAKYTALLERLRKIGVGRGAATRAVVFSERLATLGWLQTRLMRDLRMSKDEVEVMHGGLTDQRQQEIVDSFKQASSPIRVLVTGDVASEGVNLHAHCSELIHFDIPWSLIRIEQRNGRIDRYGQRARPQITTLLLDLENDRFSGDLRVLERLLEREQEAHRALGDAASLMGTYDAAAEEAEIRKVLAGQRRFEDAVPTPEQAMEQGDGIGALLARLAAAQGAVTSPPAPVATEESDGTGLFADDRDFLRAALTERYAVPTTSVARGGVEWAEPPNTGIVSFTPPADLQQRLEALPQTYLRDRHVTTTLTLAVTRAKAEERLKAARDDRTSTSSWPDAHYLGPLHPVLDWAGDHALARLGRNHVFAVRGQVDAPTVLLLGTLTDRRGQVVASSTLTVELPNPDDPAFGLVTPHPSLRAALVDLGFTAGVTVNPGPVAADELQWVIAPAVRLGREHAERLGEHASSELTQRIADWSARVDSWEHGAERHSQIADLRAHRLTVEQERLLAVELQPQHRFVRPLLVVVPETTAVAPQKED